MMIMKLCNVATHGFHMETKINPSIGTLHRLNIISEIIGEVDVQTSMDVKGRENLKPMKMQYAKYA